MSGGVVDNNGSVGGNADGIGIGGNTVASYNITIQGVDICSNGGSTGDNIDVTMTSNNLFPSGVLIQYCMISNAGNMGVLIVGGTGTVLQSNIIVNNPKYGVEIYSESGAPSQLTAFMYNNTIVGNGESTGYGVDLGAVGGTSALTLYNNIIWSNVAGAYGALEWSSASATLTSDYNDVYNTAGDWAFYYSGGKTLAAWQSATGQDMHSKSSNPQFANASGGQFWLTSGSPGIDAGSNLGSPYNIGLMPGSTWPNSVVTGDQNAYGSGWELGAFIYVPPIAPPSNLQAVAH
jgi:hypothetical protein